MTVTAPLTVVSTAQTDVNVPIGKTGKGELEINLNRVLAGRLLIQGSSGAGKSQTLRKIIEEAFDYLTVMIVDPEGEFGNLAAHIGATTIRAVELNTEGLTAAAVRGRKHRIPLHLDLTDLDPEQRIIRASAFFSGLIAVEKEYWENSVLVAIDEAHLLAPHLAGTARDAETRRLGVATLTDLCSRGRKRGVAPIIATQRLAKLATSVVSELQNFLIGINVFDRDIARAADLLGFDRASGQRFRELHPGEFYAFGPAIATHPTLTKIHPTITRHLGATPDLMEPSGIDASAVTAALDLAGLRETATPDRDSSLVMRGRRALDAFLMDPHAAAAARIIESLRQISPSATTASDLTRHIGLDREMIDGALDVLATLQAVETMPRDHDRIARLHSRLRQRLSDVKMVALS